MAKMFPHVPAPRHKATRNRSLSGKRYGGGHTGKLDPGGLPEWEDYRVFQDERSITGWVDLKNRVTAAVDTHGSALHPDTTGKLHYAKPGPSSGLLGTVFKVYLPQLELGSQATEAVFGQEVAGFASNLAPTVANAIVPGLGQAVGFAQGLQGLVDSIDDPELAVPTPRAPGLIQDVAEGPGSIVVPLAIVAALVLLIVAVRE